MTNLSVQVDILYNQKLEWWVSWGVCLLTKLKVINFLPKRSPNFSHLRPNFNNGSSILGILKICQFFYRCWLSSSAAIPYQIIRSLQPDDVGMCCQSDMVKKFTIWFVICMCHSILKNHISIFICSIFEYILWFLEQISNVMFCRKH